ncbi:MAG: RNA polymerase sigma factor [Candidatus Omnitrophica bacterium]|nr:RNA polymerase sigma factor [Candidatus Omnitrophota bacterium]
MQDMNAGYFENGTAFERIFRAYSDYVYTLAVRMLRCREDAQEVTQEVFIAVYRSLPDFRDRSHLKTWLYRITINHCLNRIRKDAARRQQTVAYADAVSAGAAEMAETGSG